LRSNALARIVALLAPSPARLTLTSIAYLRRFFVREDAALCDDALLVVLCCIYVAGKVEELPTPPAYTADKRGVHVEGLVERALELARSDVGVSLALEKSRRRDSVHRWTADVVRFEMTLLQGLRFQLICFHPLRPALALADQCGLALGKDELYSLCVKSYVAGDWVLRYPPAVLATAVVLAAAPHASDAAKVHVDNAAAVAIAKLLVG